MAKVIGKGRVIPLPVNGKPCLHLDDDRGTGMPIEGIYEIEGIPFQQEEFSPYLGEVISLSRIVKVEMINCDNGENEVLHEKNSKERCRFMKKLHYKNYEIQLRLDYNFKPTETPILDADIRDTTTDKFLPKNSFQHNTPKRHDPELNMDIYDFRFQGLIMRLYTVTTSQIQIHSNAFVDKVKTTLTHGENVQPKEAPCK